MQSGDVWVCVIIWSSDVMHVSSVTVTWTMTSVRPVVSPWLSVPCAGVFQVLSQLQAASAGHQEAGPVVSAAGAGGASQALLLQPLHEGQTGLAGGLPSAVRPAQTHLAPQQLHWTWRPSVWVVCDALYICISFISVWAVLLCSSVILRSLAAFPLSGQFYSKVPPLTRLSEVNVTQYHTIEEKNDWKLWQNKLDRSGHFVFK